MAPELHTCETDLKGDSDWWRGTPRDQVSSCHEMGDPGRQVYYEVNKSMMKQMRNEVRTRRVALVRDEKSKEMKIIWQKIGMIKLVIQLYLQQ